MKNRFADMTIAQLENFLGLPGRNQICETTGCYNQTADGLIICLQCAHGTSERADDELVNAKRELEKKRRHRAKAARAKALLEGTP